MRKAERLDYVYDEMCRLHKKYMSDWRFQQFILNYLSWYVTKYGNDGFYIEDEKIIKFIKEFIKDSVGENFND